MENNVVSLQTAKKLKEAGFPQVTYFYHVQYSNDHETNRSTICRYQDMSIEFQHPDKYHDERRFAAPMAEEVLRELKGRIQIDRYEDGKWGLFWRENATKMIANNHKEHADSLVEAAAVMYIYLKEHNLLPKKI